MEKRANSTLGSRETICGRIVDGVLEATTRECQINQSVLLKLRTLWEQKLASTSGMTLPVLPDQTESFSHLPTSASLLNQLETSSGKMKFPDPREIGKKTRSDIHTRSNQTKKQPPTRKQARSSRGLPPHILRYSHHHAKREEGGKPLPQMSQPSGYLDPSPVTVVYDEVDEVDDLPLSPPLDTPTTVNIDELPDEIPEISDVPWDEQFEWHPQFQFPQGDGQIDLPSLKKGSIPTQQKEHQEEEEVISLQQPNHHTAEPTTITTTTTTQQKRVPEQSLQNRQSPPLQESQVDLAHHHHQTDQLLPQTIDFHGEKIPLFLEEDHQASFEVDSEYQGLDFEFADSLYSEIDSELIHTSTSESQQQQKTDHQEGGVTNPNCHPPPPPPKGILLSESINSENFIICDYKKIVRRKTRMRLELLNGVAHVNGSDFFFHKCVGSCVLYKDD